MKIFGPKLYEATIFNLKSDTLQIFVFKIWTHEKIAIQSVPRFKFFFWNFDALYFFPFKAWHVVIFSVQKHAF